jgi:hypothetical protein
MDLTTVEDVQVLYDFGGAESLDNIAKFIAQVSAEFETELNRQVFIETDKTEQFNVNPGDCRFALKAWPLSAFTTAWNDTDRTFADVSIINASNYYADLTQGIIHFDKYQLSAGPGVLKVQYTGGMASTTAGFITEYPDIAYVAAMEVARRFQRRSQLDTVTLSAGGGTLTTTLQNQFLPQTLETIEKHKRIY